jgi:deoxyribodipyrimidine photolyase-like uncharacterized protein
VPLHHPLLDFLERNRDKIGTNRRMLFQLANLARKNQDECRAIRKRAETLRASFTRQTYL